MMQKLEQFLGPQEAALGLRAYRQQVLASNIANADTPNYKARDFDFGRAFEAALAQQHAPPPRPGRNAGAAALTPPLLYRHATMPSLDGNTVDLDAERARFADNAVRLEAGLTVVSMQIKQILSALHG